MNDSPPSPPPDISSLGSGRYRVQLTDAGGGGSRWDWIALDRWAADALEDAQGFFIYLRDLDSGRCWSAGRQPSAAAPDAYEVGRRDGRVTLARRDGGIDTRLQVSVDDEDELEVRELQLQNRDSVTRRIEISSYVEVALNESGSDLGHPAFSKLFVQTERDADRALLLARRRPRSATEHWPLMFHALCGAPVIAWETDRAAFIGRGRDVAAPAMAMRGTLGNVLDPVLCLRAVVDIAPGETCNLRLLLGAAADRALVDQRLDRHAADACWAVEPALDTAAKLPDIDSGFDAAGSEYRIRLRHDGQRLELPPMPWVNVIANETFGSIVTETGAGCTWSRNSQAWRLTPWANDPVGDPHGEAFYLRDEVDGDRWSPLPGPLAAPIDYEVRHGFGYSRFSSRYGDLEQSATVFVARKDPVKIVWLRLGNTGSAPRRLSLFAYQRLVLGGLPAPAGAIRCWRSGRALCAVNEQAGDFAGGITFAGVAGSAPEQERLSCDREAFIGACRSVRRPQALDEPLLNGLCDGHPDPCFARQLVFTVQPGEHVEYAFALGEAGNEAELQTLLARYTDIDKVRLAFDEIRAFWRDGLAGLSVQTPVPGIDTSINGWLPYQALSCRIWGRTAYYQSSGAYGFRDQLQDAGNLRVLWPERTRAQILLHARQQFVEGDVLHWWHADPVGRGLRTRFADDLLWLPFVTLDYLRATGDDAILDESLPFLEAPVLEAGEDERYLKPTPTTERHSLYEHCCRALDRSLARGAHGLPLMGTGDWNDGMNRVGREGRGESVWLGFFLYAMLEGWAERAQRRGEPTRAAQYRDDRAKLLEALDTTGWDGDWYRRAYYDDGTPLGTASATECRIDGLAQAWSVLSGAATAARARQAMDAAEAQLVAESDGLIRLLTPPFVDTPEDPGYIKGYVAGVRENGGQYTHAACWFVAAEAALGRRDRAAKLLTRLGPQWHTATAEQIARYQTEPYAIAADIYGADPHIGRGGWTWYTGSAGWAWRVGVESVLGLRIEGGRTLVLQPCVPDDWPRYSIDYREPGGTTHHIIEVVNPSGCSAAVIRAAFDGSPLPVEGGVLRWPLVGDDGVHRVDVELGAAVSVTASPASLL